MEVYILDNLTQEELEYRRYLQRRIRKRKRRRKVMIARTIVAVVCVLLLVGIVFLAKFIIGNISGSDSAKVNKSKVAVEQTVTPAVTPTGAPDSVIIPEGYNEVYNQLNVLAKDYPDVESVIMNLSQYPMEILKLLLDNQETLSFVKNYPKHKNDAASLGEISEEEVADGIPLLIQWDERWGYVKYGQQPLAITGCGPTCMSMIYSGLLKNTSMSPADMAEYCITKNYYSEDTGTSWAMMLEGAIDLGLNAEKISTDIDTLRKNLKKGKPMICSMIPGDFTQEGHFVVLSGLDENGMVIVNDPNSRERSEQSWKLKRIQKQIKAAWVYSLP